jgi:hypothetical protein
MAAGRGDYPFKSSWALNRINRGYDSSTQFLIPTTRYGDEDSTERTIWSEWWFTPNFAPTAISLTDDFNDNSIDVAKWNAITPGSGRYAETNQRLEVTSHTVSGTYDGLYSVNTYNLTDKMVYVQLTDAGNQSIVSLQAILKLYSSSSNALVMFVGNGIIAAQDQIGGTYVVRNTATYNSTTHKWIRIAEFGGRTYWQYSADNITWYTLYSKATPIAVTALYVELSTGIWQTETLTSVVKFDNLNDAGIVPTVLTPGPATAMVLTSYTPTVTIGTRLTPGVATQMTLTAFAPTVTIGYKLTPGVAPTLTLTSFAPTVTVGTRLTPGVATQMVLTSFAPTVTVSNNVSLTPGVATPMALTSYPPTVTIGTRVTPGVGTTMVLTSYVPTVTVSDNKFVIPGPATPLVLTSYAPTVTVSITITITPGPATAMVLTSFAPSVRVGTVLSPAPATPLVLTSYAPTVTVGADIFLYPAPANTMVLTPYAPSVTISDNTFLSPGAADQMVLTSYPPELTIWTPAQHVLIWTGTEWHRSTTKVWTGSAWEDKPLKAWTGSVWK